MPASTHATHRPPTPVCPSFRQGCTTEGLRSPAPGVWWAGGSKEPPPPKSGSLSQNGTSYHLAPQMGGEKHNPPSTLEREPPRPLGLLLLTNKFVRRNMPSLGHDSNASWWPSLGLGNTAGAEILEGDVWGALKIEHANIF